MSYVHYYSTDMPQWPAQISSCPYFMSHNNIDGEIKVQENSNSSRAQEDEEEEEEEEEKEKEGRRGRFE